MDIQKKLQFTSIEEMKSKGEFFKRGSIVPRRILAASSRRFQSRITFGSDSWAFPTPKGYLVFSNSDMDGEYLALRITECICRIMKKKITIDGSIYTPGGGTDILGSINCNNKVQWLETINKHWELKLNS